MGSPDEEYSVRIRTTIRHFDRYRTNSLSCAENGNLMDALFLSCDEPHVARLAIGARFHRYPVPCRHLQSLPGGKRALRALVKLDSQS